MPRAGSSEPATQDAGASHPPPMQIGCSVEGAWEDVEVKSWFGYLVVVGVTVVVGGLAFAVWVLSLVF
ncbi:hypothetical protein GCM10009804_14730 [Kribbella hippodromi]|uniref:Uncharacterized protein n=1 Tax=Kribbella hippodromi TaxID=434347 RepID=A0ABN2CI95_9ACTN